MNLQQRRKEKGYTQAQLADLSGVNVRLIQHYEQGIKQLRKAAAETVLAIARALDCTVEDLIDDGNT